MVKMCGEKGEFGQYFPEHVTAHSVDALVKSMKEKTIVYVVVRGIPLGVGTRQISCQSCCG